MPPARKVTVELPADLLRRAQKSSGAGITSTIRRGLELVAAGRAYRDLRQLPGAHHLFGRLEQAAGRPLVIAVDTSSFVAYLSGARGPDVDAVDAALADNQACLPPVVLSEMLSDPKLPTRVAALVRQLPLLAITEGYWDRAGILRSALIALQHRARLADTLIAQTCLDHDVALITRDADFKAFARVGRLTIVP